MCAIATLLVSISAIAQVPTGSPGLPIFSGKSQKSAANTLTDSASVVKVSLVQAADSASANGDLVVAVRLSIAPGWHVWSHASQAQALPGAVIFDGAVFSALSITPSNGALVLLGSQWPQPRAAKADIGNGPHDYAVYEGSVNIFARVGVGANASGKVEAALLLALQACNASTCLAPADIELPISVRVAANAASNSGAAIANNPLFANYDPARMVAMVAATSSAKPEHSADDALIHFDFFGTNFSVDPRGIGFALVLLVAFIGGMLLNFTPCVLPVIPLKIMSLSAVAGDRSRCLRLGFTMSAGVVAFWIMLGLLIGGFSGFTAANQLFQYPWFTIGLGLFIAVMAFGMAGFFSVNLPQWVHSIEATHESAGGSFVMGVMTAVLSTPCTAPLMGAAAGWAASSGSIATVLVVFGTIGCGMASPYALLSAFPHLAKKMPRTGPGSEVVKQVMGILLLAAAIFFIGAGVNGLLAIPSLLHWWIMGALGAWAGVWLAWRTLYIARSKVRRTFFVVLGLLIAAISLSAARELGTDHGRIAWVRYSEQAFQQAKQEVSVIVLNFTAEWCLNCKALEHGVLDRADVSGAISQPGVRAIKVDITNRASAGWNLLHQYDRVSIPLLVIQKADGTVTLKSDAYTPDQVIKALQQAQKN